MQLWGLLLVLGTVTLESCCQFCFKKGATSHSPKPWIALAISIYAVQIMLWSVVLHLVDVSIAHPMCSLSLVLVALMSFFFLKEKLTPQRWMGIVLIVSGTTLVGLR